MSTQLSAQDELEEAVKHLRAYERRTPCMSCAADIEPYAQALTAISERDRLLEALVRTKLAQPPAQPLLKEAVKERDETVALAREEGLKVGPLARPGRETGLMPFRPGAMLRETGMMVRQSFKVIPRPGRLLRGNFMIPVSDEV